MERKVNYNVAGKERRELVTKIAEITGEHPVYMGMPSIGFKVGPFEISRLGVLTWEDWADGEAQNLISKLQEAGYCPTDGEKADNNTIEEIGEIGQEKDSAKESEQEGDEMEEKEEPITVSISVPDNMRDEEFKRLEQIVSGKATLLKHAFKTDDLTIERSDNQISFPWFIGSDSEHTASYTIFIVKLIELAKNSKRVTAKDKPVENERYAFRCFLLRLGFIGDEFKSARKVLQENLTGSSAFKSGHRSTPVEEKTSETA